MAPVTTLPSASSAAPRWVAGGARGVVERDRVPLVLRHQPVLVGIAVCEEGFVVEAADPLAGARVFGVVHVDDEGLDGRLVEGGAGGSGELPVDDQHLRLAMVEAEGQRLRVENTAAGRLLSRVIGTP